MTVISPQLDFKVFSIYTEWFQWCKITNQWTIWHMLNWGGGVQTVFMFSKQFFCCLTLFLKDKETVMISDFFSVSSFLRQSSQKPFSGPRDLLNEAVESIFLSVIWSQGLYDYLLMNRAVFCSGNALPALSASLNGREYEFQLSAYEWKQAPDVHICETCALKVCVQLQNTETDCWRCFLDV